jgi:tetratricopeptide (TPR) repeat protein
MIQALADLIGLHGYHARIALVILLLLFGFGIWLALRSLGRRWLAEPPTVELGGPAPPSRSAIRGRLRREGEALRRDAPTQPAERAYRLGLIAGLRGARSWLRAAPAASQRALSVLHPLPEPERIAVATRVADALFDFGLGEMAEPWYRSALLEAERLPDLGAATHALSRLSLLRYRAGDLDEAEEWLRPVLDPLRATGDRRALARCELTLGLVRRAKGNYGPARAALRRAIDIFKESGDGQGAATGLAELGATFELEGDQYGALEYWAEAISRFRMTGLDKDADALQLRSDRLARALASPQSERTRP